jgi:hypothetical protein
MNTNSNPAPLAVGARVYYSGNMANQSAMGTVVEIRGHHYGIRWDDDAEYAGKVAFMPCAMLGACTYANVHHGNALFELGDYKRQRNEENERFKRMMARAHGGES